MRQTLCDDCGREVTTGVYTIKATGTSPHTTNKGDVYKELCEACFNRRWSVIAGNKDQWGSVSYKPAKAAKKPVKRKTPKTFMEKFVDNCNKVEL